MSKKILTVANFLLDLMVILSLVLAGTYAVYSLYDNQRIYADAGDVQADMMKYKPSGDDGDASFEELLAINPDVCAWVTLDGSKIDYPVLQGATNLTYINKDVYGNFSLAGSIFLDSRNGRDFSDSYNLLYGHHMAQRKMFGDLEKYQKKMFFKKHKTGTLILPDKTYKLEIFACLLANAGEENIFDPRQWQTDIDGLISYAEKNSLQLRKETVKEIKQMEDPKILAFSTCSTEYTDARTIVLAVMELE